MAMTVSIQECVAFFVDIRRAQLGVVQCSARGSCAFTSMRAGTDFAEMDERVRALLPGPARELVVVGQVLAVLHGRAQTERLRLD